MAYLLRGLLILMLLGLGGTTLTALGLWQSPLGHIQLGLISFLYSIFAQAFVMFYFIGISRFTKNIYHCLDSKESLSELFETPPDNLAPYKKKTYQFVLEADRSKRQTVPWGMLILVLGSIAFLLGGAHHTQLVEKTTHSGVAYGFLIAMLIGFVRQWYYLGRGHLLLRKIKGLFQIPEGSM